MVLAEKEILATNSSTLTDKDVEKALKNFPEEERALLQAAIQSGELETGSVLTAIKSVFIFLKLFFFGWFVGTFDELSL